MVVSEFSKQLTKTYKEVWPSGLRYWFAKSARQEEIDYNVVRLHVMQSLITPSTGKAEEQSMTLKP